MVEIACKAAALLQAQGLPVAVADLRFIKRWMRNCFWRLPIIKKYFCWKKAVCHRRSGQRLPGNFGKGRGVITQAEKITLPDAFIPQAPWKSCGKNTADGEAVAGKVLASVGRS